MDIKEKIYQLKKEKDVVILAHYYVEAAVQEIADFIGDSYALAVKAAEAAQNNILFAGVSFMGESAKLLNPDKHVYMADGTAGCPMADMVTADQVRQIRAKYPDAYRSERIPGSGRGLLCQFQCRGKSRLRRLCNVVQCRTGGKKADAETDLFYTGPASGAVCGAGNSRKGIYFSRRVLSYPSKDR